MLLILLRDSHHATSFPRFRCCSSTLHTTLGGGGEAGAASHSLHYVQHRVGSLGAYDASSDQRDEGIKEIHHTPVVTLSRQEAHILVQVTLPVLLQQMRSTRYEQFAPSATQSDDDNHQTTYANIVVRLTVEDEVNKDLSVSCKSGRVPWSGIRTCFTQLGK